MPTHRRLDPYSRSRDAALELARADPRNARLHGARSLLAYLPFAFVYPLAPECLLLVVLLGAGIWLGFQALVGLWFGVPLLAGALVYLLEVAAHAANGFGTTPVFTAAHLAHLPLVALEAVLIGALAVSAVMVGERSSSDWVVWSAPVVGGLLLPGVLVTLAVEQSLLRALDPRQLAAFVLRGGVPYLAVAALTALLLHAAPGQLPGVPEASELISGRKTSGVLWAITVFYLALVAAHLLGAMVFLRREALGFAAVLQAKSADQLDSESLQESVARLLALADVEEDQRRGDAAANLLRTGPFGSHAARPWLEELFEGACRRPKPYFAEAAGQRLVSHLVTTRQWPRALEVVVHATQRWSRFQPSSLPERVTLAEQALERGMAHAFRQLSADIGALGADPAAVDLGFLAARWAAEREDNHAAARAHLAPLLARREHPSHRRIVALDAALRT